MEICTHCPVYGICDKLSPTCSVHVVVCQWWSSTLDWLRSTAGLVWNTCSAKADVWKSPFFSARWCSLTCCLRLLPVWSMYTLEHSTQGMEYTTPLYSLTGTGSFGRTSIWQRVCTGQLFGSLFNNLIWWWTFELWPRPFILQKLVITCLLGHLASLLASGTSHPHVITQPAPSWPCYINFQLTL